MTHPSPISGLAERVRHKKRGSEYEVLGVGKMQAEGWSDNTVFLAPGGHPSVDMREVAIYRSVDDGSLWVRPREEFEDGRFEVLASPLPVAAPGGVTEEMVERALDAEQVIGPDRIVCWSLREALLRAPVSSANVEEYVRNALEASITKTAAPLGVDWNGAPERLWLGSVDPDGEHEVWFDPDEGGTPYVRADLALPIPAPDAQANAGLVAARRIASEQCASAANVRIPDGGPIVMFVSAPDAQAVAVKASDYGVKLIAEAISHHFGEQPDIEEERPEDDDTTLFDVWEAFDALTATPVTGEADVERLANELSIANHCLEENAKKVLAAESRVEALTAEMAAAKAEAFEEAAQIADAEYQRHNTGSGFDSHPARETAYAIREAIRSRAASKGGADK